MNTRECLNDSKWRVFTQTQPRHNHAHKNIIKISKYLIKALYISSMNRLNLIGAWFGYGTQVTNP